MTAESFRASPCGQAITNREDDHLMEYALTAEALLGFGRRFVRSGGALSAWAPFVDNVGPPLLPMVIRPDKYDEIPLVALGYSAVKLAALVPQPGEVWVLFCYRESFRTAVGDGTPLRTDGFPLILEWRKDVSDSPLLSAAFHRLADRARKQLGVAGWGLCPAYGRYGDKIAFTDIALFGDEDGDSSSVASAYGAVLAGLSSAVSGRHPPFWPFPTLQWDGDRCKPRGVAGLKEKLSVAADCGATVVTVASEQKREALGLLAELQSSDTSGRYGRLSVLAVKDVSDPRRLARRICDDAAARIRAKRITVCGAVLFAVMIASALAYWLDWRREKIEYYADYVERDGVAEGRFPISEETMAKWGRSYRFHYRGYDSFVPWFRKRVLREMWCVNGKGYIRVDVNDYPEHPSVAGFRYGYDARGRVSEIERCQTGGRVGNVIRYSGDHAELADVFRTAGGRIASGAMRFSAFRAGDAVRRIEYVRNAEGFVTKKIYRRVSSGMAAADGQGISQLSFELLNDGRIAVQRYLDWRGAPVADTNGVHLTRFTYDGHRLTRIQYCGLDEKPISTSRHEDECVYLYSPQGNLSKIEKRGAGRVREALSFERDAAGDVVREVYFWAECVRHAKDWSAREICFDNAGNVIRETFFDSEGRKWKRTDGRIATVERKYSPIGDLTEEAFRDEIGKPMLGAGGWAKRTLSHEMGDDGRKTICRRYFGEDEKPATIPGEGFACDKKSFDAAGRIVKWELFGVDDEKVDGSQGWQRAVFEYGRDGGLSARRFYDKFDKLIAEEK